MKDNKTTRVETSMLYVYNTPDQFVQLMLRSWYKGKKLTSAPAKVDLEVFSFSKNLLAAIRSFRTDVFLKPNKQIAVEAYLVDDRGKEYVCSVSF